MRFKRLISGVSLLCASAFVGMLFNTVFHTDQILGVAVSSIVAFLGGCLFMNGWWSW